MLRARGTLAAALLLLSASFVSIGRLGAQQLLIEFADLFNSLATSPHRRKPLHALCEIMY
jgi:hypothetical protein